MVWQASPSGFGTRPARPRAEPLSTARLHLAFAEREGLTVVTREFAQAPFKLRSTRTGQDGSLVVQITMLGPGLVAGDCYEQIIDVGKGAKALVLFTSATKLLGSGDRSCATQDVTINVADGSLLEYYPGLAIPFSGAAFDQRVRVHLEGDARIGVLEMWATGRVESGEEMLFDRIDSRTDLMANGSLVYRDAMLWRPREVDHRGLGMLEGHRYAGSGYWTWGEPTKYSVDDSGVEIATGEPAAGGLYLRGLAHEGVALRREVLRFLTRQRSQSGLAPVDFTRYTTMLS